MSGPTKVRHPARYSDAVLEVMAPVLEPGMAVLDPFAGTGRVHELAEECDVRTIGVELEPEWAALGTGPTLVGDARALPFPARTFDAVVTSPAYGNRMADHHEARDGSRQITYRHCLGRPLTPGNSGAMQWGPAYRELHHQAWAEAARVLVPGGLLVLNVSDHVRAGRVVPVTAWHLATLVGLGFTLAGSTTVATPRMRFGANHGVRVEGETVAFLVNAARHGGGAP